jgi:hypothetical protein
MPLAGRTVKLKGGGIKGLEQSRRGLQVAIRVLFTPPWRWCVRRTLCSAQAKACGDILKAIQPGCRDRSPEARRGHLTAGIFCLYYKRLKEEISGGVLPHFSVLPIPQCLSQQKSGKRLTNNSWGSNFIKLKFGQFWPRTNGARGWRSSMVERLICNQQVAGSSPIASSREDYFFQAGEVPEWPKGTGCKPVGVAYGGSNPPLSTRFPLWCGNSSMARASAFQAEGCGFESRFPLQFLGPRSSVGRAHPW